MPFINRRQVALETRAKAEKAYRMQLRQALSNPALTLAQRQELQLRLGEVGKPRVYRESSPPTPGAIVLQEPSSPLSQEELEGMKKPDLVALAESKGLPASGTKAALVERLLDS